MIENTMKDQSLQTKSKQHIWQLVEALQFVNLDQLSNVLPEYYSEDTIWNGPEPINQLVGIRQQIQDFWTPFLTAFPNPQKRIDIFMSGEFEGEQWVSLTGHYSALFQHEWLGIPATGMSTFVRYGEFLKIRDNAIVETITILDIPGVMEQAGIPVFPTSLGASHQVPGPALQNGIRLIESDPVLSQSNLLLVEDMIKGLMQYDGKDLASMPIEQYWHPHFMWYGPTGIGHSRGLQGFRDIHQRPFLNAFPDRKGGNHGSRFADGQFVCSTGWPSIQATHQGSGWLGMPATGKAVEMRVMDWWSCDKNQLLENWVFIDIPHLTKQMGYDVFERMKGLTRRAARWHENGRLKNDCDD